MYDERVMTYTYHLYLLIVNDSICMLNSLDISTINPSKFVI